MAPSVKAPTRSMRSAATGLFTLEKRGEPPALKLTCNRKRFYTFLAV